MLKKNSICSAIIIRILLGLISITFTVGPIAIAQAEVSDEYSNQAYGKQVYSAYLKLLSASERTDFDKLRKSDPENFYEYFGRIFKNDLNSITVIMNQPDKTCMKLAASYGVGKCGVSASEFCAYQAWQRVLGHFNIKNPALQWIDGFGRYSKTSEGVEKRLRNCPEHQSTPLHMLARKDDAMAIESNINGRPIEDRISPEDVASLNIPEAPSLYGRACIDEQKAIESAQKSFSKALIQYNQRINQLRDAYRLKVNQVNNQKKYIKSLQKESRELDDMDASGLDQSRMDAAIKQGINDINRAFTNLKKDEMSSAAARKILNHAKQEGSPTRVPVEDANRQLKDSQFLMQECLKGHDLIKTQDNGKQEDELIPDLPEDTEEESMDKKNPPLPPPVPRADYEAVMIVDGSKSIIHFTPGKRRTVPVEHPDNVSIFRDDKNLIWQLWLKEKKYVEIKLPGKPAVKQSSRKKLASERINGLDSTKFQIESTGSNGYKSNGTFWISQEGITVKSISSFSVNGQKRTTKAELSDIKITPQNPELFEIPTGFTLRNMNSATGFK